MPPHLATLFDEAEHRYLKPEELKRMSQYVGSLPERIVIYRTLRDRELEVMQAVANQLQIALPQAGQVELERSLRQAMLMLRHCAMAMLLNDETIIQEHVNWVRPTAQIFNTLSLDILLCRLLHQQLAQLFSSQQLDYLTPMLQLAQQAFSIAPLPPANH